MEQVAEHFISRKSVSVMLQSLHGGNLMSNMKQIKRLVYVMMLVFFGASMLSGCIIAPPYGGYYGGYYGGRGDGWHHGEDR